jgi:cysteinyl-tRNA synthetase
MQSLATQTVDRMRAALDDDLNTAQAQAAIFEMVRSANSAIDSGQMKADDVPRCLPLEKFDEIFAVLKDDDGPKMKQVFDWAPTEGREKDISAELTGSRAVWPTLGRRHREENRRDGSGPHRARLSRRRTPCRAELTAAGIIIENTKDGVRWRRK